MLLVTVVSGRVAKYRGFPQLSNCGGSDSNGGRTEMVMVTATATVTSPTATTMTATATAMTSVVGSGGNNNKGNGDDCGGNSRGH